jgi:hypothetical protein
VRFDELILQVPDDELRVRFHPELTVLSGLGVDERRSLADGILGALTGGPDPSQLRYLDGDGEPVIVRGQDGRITAERPDGTSVAPPLGTVAPDRVALRALMLVSADDLGVLTRAARSDEPPELREARDMLDELTAELDAARGQQQAVEVLQSKLEAVDAELSAALDGVARREYAQILARLERVRAEAAALQTGTAGIEADRHLLANADAARAIAAEWAQANAVLTDLATRLEGQPRLGPDERDRAAQIPARPPEHLAELVAALQGAIDIRDTLDHRLQALSVAKLPAPSDPLVAELGLLDQTVLWRAAERCVEASDAMHNVQLSLGGLELDEMGPPPAVIEEIESAHSALEDAERAVEAATIPARVGIGVGVAVALLGLFTIPLIAPVGLAGAVVAVAVGILRPRARRAHAARVEHAALVRADASSYLAFHIRRVEASVDPKLRDLIEATTLEQRAAGDRWLEVAGAEIEVTAALALRAEIEAYHDALRNLGETADEIEQLRRELEDGATPALARAQEAVEQACAPYLLDDVALDAAGVAAAVAAQCDRGAAARAQIELDDAEVEEQKIASRLDDLLLELGFDAGPIDARVGALDWAVSRAAEREDARRQARPREEIDAELHELQDAAAQLRRPEWATVTAADAATPDIPELEAERAEVLAQLTAARADVDVDRLADRHAAVERRVAALEARHVGHEANGDPGAIADIQQHLLAHLATASEAGPDGDPVPVVLDEVFLRVPADRKWDLLDLLHRLAERHQLIYLSDDAFVAAWARQRALDGSITLLELTPEHA